MSRVLTSALLLCLAWPQAAGAAKPRRDAAGERGRDGKPDPVGTLSQAGTRRGELEFGLGGVLTGTAGALLGFGVSQFMHARAQADFCAMGGGSSGIDPCTFDPPPLGYASAGLSWGFSALALIGAGLLFARGARVHADARTHARLQMSWFIGPTISGPRAAGASFGLRF